MELIGKKLTRKDLEAQLGQKGKEATAVIREMVRGGDSYDPIGCHRAERKRQARAVLCIRGAYARAVHVIKR